MTELVLETERLALRTVGEDDVAMHDALFNTPAIKAHLGGRIEERHELEARHARAIAMYARHRFSFLFWVEKRSGEVIGYGGIKLVDNPRAPNPGDHEIGWLVREDRWREGFAREAMRAVIDWGFTRVDAPHLVALTSEANVASWKLMEKLGMERARELDFTDPAFPPRDNPTIQYRLDRAQWENLQ